MLTHALQHPDLPAIVGDLARRGVPPRVRVRDERVTRALASRLREIGVAGIEVDLHGDEARHDAREGRGTWRARVASLHACRESGLPSRARLHVDADVAGTLAALLDVLDRVASDVRVIESGALDADTRERVVATTARFERADFVGFGLHGPAPGGAPVAIDAMLVHTARRAVRVPRYEAGTLARESPALPQAIERAGGLRALGGLLECMGATARDLPFCMGGRGEALGPASHSPACEPCALRTRCGGLASGLAPRGARELGPRRGWRGLALGARVRICRTRDEVIARFGVPPMAARLVALGCDVRSGDEVRSDDDVVLAWGYAQAFEVLDAKALSPSARVIVGDFHMLEGRERLVSRSRDGWPDERLEVVSAYPSFPHLYSRSGVPLDRLTFRPYPVGPIAPRETGPAGFAGGNHARAWGVLEGAARRLGSACPPIRVAHAREVEVARVGGLEPLGLVAFDDFMDELARARFVVLPIVWDRNVCAGGSVMALALAFGRPLIATRVPMVLDHLRDGVDSILVDPDDTEGMADAIRRMHEDDALRGRLAEGARRRAQTASAAAWADELVHGALPAPDLGLRAWP